MRGRMLACSGFSIVEVLMATSLLLMIVAAAFGALRPAQGAFAVQPERAEMEQRLRAAVEAISRDLKAAGAGLSQGERPGPLSDALPPVLPFRQGRRSPDPPGRVRTDLITVLRVAGSPAQTTLAQPLAARSSPAQVTAGPGCPPGDPSCGFRRGMDVVVFDDTGAYDSFTIAAVQAATLTLQHNTRDSEKVYAPGSRIAEVVSRSYFRKSDAAHVSQLMQYDGAGGHDVPVVNHVVGLDFEYLGEPRPPRLVKPISEPFGPWTTYGPAPTAAGNCLFEANGTPQPAPRLPVLGDGETLVPLTARELSDGPWCPDAGSPNRYDADLFRIRGIAVRLRVEAAPGTLRGAVGAFFARGGSSTIGALRVADREVRLELTPPNLAGRR